MAPVSPRTRRVNIMKSKRLMLKDTQHRFRRACDQIVLLNRRMEGVLHRYHKARDHLSRGFRYKLRLRLAIVEGIRNMFYEYANRKAFEIVNLRRDMFGEIVEIVTDERREDDVMYDDDDVENADYIDSDDESMYDSEEEDDDDSEEEDEEMEDELDIEGMVEEIDDEDSECDDNEACEVSEVQVSEDVTAEVQL